MMLSQLGHETTSVYRVDHAFQLMAEKQYALVILGHSLLSEEKVSLGDVARVSCGCPVLELSTTGTPYAQGAVTIEPFNPELFIATVQRILSNSSHAVP
jgi:DNA-binding response OmpR family regulator